MVRASALLDGITAPVEIGFSIQERMNCISSSRRWVFFATRTTVREGIDAVTRAEDRYYPRNFTGIAPRAVGQDGYSEWLSRFPRPSRKSFTRLKNPADSGWVASDDSFSNSARSSRWRLVRFCGVSTDT